MADDAVELLPPEDVVLGARAVMGSIDLDPWSCTIQNILVQSARYFNRDQEDINDICSREWQSRGERRVFAALKGAKDTKRILNKTLAGVPRWPRQRSSDLASALRIAQSNSLVVELPGLHSLQTSQACLV